MIDKNGEAHPAPHRRGRGSVALVLAVGVAAASVVVGARALASDREQPLDCPSGTESRRAIVNDGSARVCVDAAGTPHGPYRERYPSGELRVTGQFARGARDGTWTRWLPSGAPLERIELRGGEKHGLFRAFRADGTVQELGSFHEDRMVGVWPIVDRRGRTVAERWFDFDGRLVARRVYENGIVIAARDYAASGEEASAETGGER